MTELEKQLTEIVTHQTAQIGELLSQNKALNEKIALMQEQLDYLLKKLFGKSSEKTKIGPGQLSIFGETADASVESEDIETAEEVLRKAQKRPKRQGHKEALIKHLDVKEIHHELGEDERQCRCCGEVMQPLGQKEVRSHLCFVPARLYVEKHIQHTYHCPKQCHDDAIQSKPIITASVPKPPIQNSLASPSTLSHLYYQKYKLSLPIYRQEAEWERYGVSLSRRTLTNWIIISAHDWLMPIYQRLLSHLLSLDILHADETPYQVLKRSDGKPATSEARMWIARTTQGQKQPVIAYHSSLTRSQRDADAFLAGFSGYLHSDYADISIMPII